MKIKSTRLKIAFFSILLVGLIVIQYSWVQSLQNDKLQEFNTRMISGIEDADKYISFTGSQSELTNTSLANILRRSFSYQGLSNIDFEFSMGSGNRRIASQGFHQKLTNNPNNLVLYYEFQRNGEKESSVDLLTVIVSKKFAFKGMAWIIEASILLTIMVLTIFYYALILGERRQQLFYDNRTNAIKNMMQQLETPLSTVSVAAEALTNARVMHDSVKINYYQQIINEESKRMNEQVKQFLQELK